MRRSLLATVLLVLSLATAASAVGAPSVFWKNYREPSKVEPTRIRATGLGEWEGWGTGHATSHGVAHLNTCRPYCAAGNYKAYKAAVTLSKIRTCGQQHRYLDIEVRVAGKPPAIWGSECRGAQIVNP